MSKWHFLFKGQFSFFLTPIIIELNWIHIHFFFTKCELCSTQLKYISYTLRGIIFIKIQHLFHLDEIRWTLSVFVSKISTCNCSSILNKVTHTRYLGIVMDQHMKWDRHIDSVCNKLRNIYKFYNFRNFLKLPT